MAINVINSVMLKGSKLVISSIEIMNTEHSKENTISIKQNK